MHTWLAPNYGRWWRQQFPDGGAMFPDVGGGGGMQKFSWLIKRVDVKKLMNGYQYSLYTSNKRNNIQIIEVNKQSLYSRKFIKHLRENTKL